MRTEKRHKRANSSVFYSPLSENLTWFHLRKMNEYTRAGRLAYTHRAPATQGAISRIQNGKKLAVSEKLLHRSNYASACNIGRREKEREREMAMEHIRRSVRFMQCILALIYSVSFPFGLNEAGVCVSVTAALCFLRCFHRLI